MITKGSISPQGFCNTVFSVVPFTYEVSSPILWSLKYFISMLFIKVWALYVKDFVTCASLQVYQAVRLNKYKPTSLNANMQISYLQITRPLEVTWFHGFELHCCNTFTLYFILYNCTTTQYCCQLKMEETSNFSVGGSWCIMSRETFLATTSMQPGRNCCRALGRSKNLERGKY